MRSIAVRGIRSACWVLTALVISLLGWASTAVAAQVSAPIFTVWNLANQVELGYTKGLPYGAVLVTWGADPENRVYGIGAEMLDGTTLVNAFASPSSNLGIWYDAYPYELTVSVDPVTGQVSTASQLIDPSTTPSPPSIEEQRDDEGIVSITYRGIGTGPIAGHSYQYVLLTVQQGLSGNWHIERVSTFGSFPSRPLYLVTVGPPYAERVYLDGDIATFLFHAPVGADEAIIQVTRDGSWDLVPDSYYEREISGAWTSLTEDRIESVQVDLSQVPGDGDTYFWRIGARLSTNPTGPRPYPISDLEWHGWVWSGRDWFKYETGIFSDVPTLYWAYPEIIACADAGIVGGFPDDTYCPHLAVTRDQMAVYISRALVGGDQNVPAPPTTATFSDVPTDHWAYRYIEHAHSAGVVFGYGEQYLPDLAVDRAQMAVFIARAISDGDASVPAGPAEPTFSDIPPSHWAYRYVECIAAHEIAKGYPDGLYHPETVCTRDQMAVYMTRAFGLQIDPE